MPVTAVSFAICAFSVMGVPPFGGFFGKYLVLTGAFTAGDIAIGLTFVVGSFLTILYLFRIFTMIFLGEAKGASDHSGREGSRGMVVSVAALAALALASGLFVKYPAEMVTSTAREIVRSAR
jgi:formate hydrogenlyase subunit 3/multisubunit Na+/H+ antiporter MnhD subunit